jgi:hypothetical protein
MAGYLISTPNPNFCKKTAGIQFTNGQVFLDLTTVYDRFVVPMPSIQDRNYRPNDYFASLEARNMPTAERAAKFLANDFHYTSVYIGG